MVTQACKTPDQLDLKAADVDFYLPPHSSEECPPGLPWGSRGWESTCQLRGHRLHSWCEKTPCALEATATEATHLGPVLYTQRSQHSEKSVYHNEE